MGIQVIRTEGGEELVVISRRDYDTLLATLGDEEAEDRMTGRIVSEGKARLQAGTETLVPWAIAEGLIAGQHPVHAVRLHVGQTLGGLAAATGIPETEIVAVESGSRVATAHELVLVACALGVDPGWLK